MTDVTSVGEISVDMIQTGISDQGLATFAACPGGAPANVAAAAAKLGASSAFLGKVGQDVFGDMLIRTLQDCGVSTKAVRRGGRPTTMACMSGTPGGGYSLSVSRGADQDYSVDDVDEAALRDTRILHFGSVSLTAGPSRSATIFAAREARAGGAVISFSPNYRPVLWPEAASALQWMLIPLPLADIIRVTEEELRLLTGTEDLERGSAELQDRGISLVLVTLGSEGVFYRWQSAAGTVPGVPVTVADTIAAGDTFTGAVLSRLARRPEGPLTDLGTEELEEILSFGCLAAALSCTRSGGIPAMPTLEEVSACRAG